MLKLKGGALRTQTTPRLLRTYEWVLWFSATACVVGIIGLFVAPEGPALLLSRGVAIICGAACLADLAAMRLVRYHLIGPCDPKSSEDLDD